jgi:hypothetical protein
MMRRALKTRRRGVWKISQRRAFGQASFQRPSRHSNWNHRTRSRCADPLELRWITYRGPRTARATTISQLAFASKLVKGNRQSPVLQSLNVTLDVGVGAHSDIECHRVAVSVGVEAPVAELVTGKETTRGPGVQGPLVG